MDALNIAPSIYHINEGHSSLLCFELAGQEMKKQHIGFAEAKNIVKKKVVFSNHTLVTQGHDVYSNELASVMLSKFINEFGISTSDILSCGNVQESNSFSLSILPLRMAGKTNAVSKLHATKALDIWPEYPMIPVTNGINVKYWNAIPDETQMWQAHMENKRELINEIRLASDITFPENALLLGWARRLVEYKRPNALFENISRLKNILTNTQHPVRVVLSGSLHPSDLGNEKFFNSLRDVIEKEFKNLVVFLPGYDLNLAKLLVAGCDAWLNTPVVGFEACGTSGMKAALNGVLPVSTSDGWVDEIDLFEIGWRLNNDHVNESLLNIIANDLIPLFFYQDSKKIPHKWVTNMINSRSLIKSSFSSTRMARDYIEKLYLPLMSADE